MIRYLILPLILSPAALFAQANAVITGPDRVKPGDLVVLDASESLADDLEWILVGSDKQFLAFEHDRKLVFASGDPGRYTFILAVSLSDVGGSAVSVAQHVVIVGEPAPPPQPDPPAPPPPDLDGTAKQAYEQALAIDRRSGEASGLSRGLLDVARQADAKGWDLRTINTEVQQAGRAVLGDDARARWDAFNRWFGGLMAGAQTPAAAVELLTGVARGLEAVPETRATGSPQRSLRGMVNELKGNLHNLQREVGE